MTGTPPVGRDLKFHFEILGWLHIAYGFVTGLAGLFVGLLLMGIGAGVASSDATATAVLFIVGITALIFMGVITLLHVLAGYAFLKRPSWGRPAAGIVSGLSLFSIPIGTVVGIYGLWALLQPEAPGYFGAPDALAAPGTAIEQR